MVLNFHQDGEIKNATVETGIPEGQPGTPTENMAGTISKDERRLNQVFPIRKSDPIDPWDILVYWYRFLYPYIQHLGIFDESDFSFSKINQMMDRQQNHGIWRVKTPFFFYQRP